MIIACYMNGTFVQTEVNAANQQVLKDALWIDLINPTDEEEVLVEHCLGMNIPSLEEMREIELSSRLYKEDDVLFMTATMVAQSASNIPKQDSVTFVLTPKQMITIRYIEPQAFKLFVFRLKKLHIDSPITIFTELLDTTVDRLADILGEISHQLEVYSRTIFQLNKPNNMDYHQLLQQLGVNGELNSKIVESLVSFNRLIAFFSQSSNKKLNSTDLELLSALSKDIISLSDHASFLSNKVGFLLEATLGMVQIDQNSIIKIFSVAAVIFLPPTLIASIYGMNFTHMPELTWKHGYILAIILMLFSSWMPYKYFKYRKWL